MPWIIRDVPVTGNVIAESFLESADFSEFLDVAHADYVTWSHGNQKKEKLDSLKGKRDERIETGGVQYTVASVPHVFNADQLSRTLIDGALSVDERGNATFFPIDWINQDEETVNVTKADLTSINDLVGRFYQETYAHFQSLRISIKAAIDQTALDAIDINAGWPITPYTGI
jgi:hypothetical protein